MRSDVGVRCKKCRMEINFEVPSGSTSGKYRELTEHTWKEHRKGCNGEPEWLKNGKVTP